MKKHLTNEKQLADKLQRVPLPDMEGSWQQMKELLEKELPKAAPAAFGRSRRFWGLGIAGLLIITVVGWWIIVETDRNATSGLEKVTTAENSIGAVEGGTAVPEVNKARASESASSINENIKPESRLNETSKPESEKTLPGSKESSKPESNKTSATSKETSKPESGKTLAASNEFSKHESNKVIPRENITPKSEPNKLVSQPTKTLSRGSNGKRSNPNNNYQSQIANSPTDNKTVSARGDRKTIHDEHAASNPADKQKTDPITEKASLSSNVEATSVAPASREVRFADPVAMESLSAASPPGQTFNNISGYNPDAMAVVDRTSKEFKRAWRKNQIAEDDRKISRANMRGNFGERDRDITFAAGIAVPQQLAISGQQPSSYNINAKTGRLLDYLPAPFFQYHINSKLFLQTEFHFQSPQYTERLLFSSSTRSSTNYQNENRIYLEKLYYFNIPFNVYFSPARNFFLGSGVQYSSLLGGVASFENRSTQGQTVIAQENFTRRFKDDSVASAFSPNEWRYQFDANYYFRRFTLGLRYNQAMTDFIDLPASTNLPLIRQRNKSFMLYLRFNIWEERKKVAE